MTVCVSCRLYLLRYELENLISRETEGHNNRGKSPALNETTGDMSVWDHRYIGTVSKFSNASSSNYNRQETCPGIIFHSLYT